MENRETRIKIRKACKNKEITDQIKEGLSVGETENKIHNEKLETILEIIEANEWHKNKLILLL